MIPHRAKRDLVEPEIIGALRAVGASVAQLSQRGLPDLLVGLAGRTVLLEVKGARGKLTPDQETFLALWRGGTVTVVHSVSEALAALEDATGRQFGGRVA